MIKVAKFGGSSVADASQFRKVRDIVLSDPSRRLVVVSAAGKRDSKDHKITDLLYLCHAHLTYGVSCDEILQTVESRLTEIRDELDIPVDISAELAAFRRKLSRDSSVDEIVSRGEYFTSKLMAAFLGVVLSIYLVHPTSSATFFVCLLIGVLLGIGSFRYDREVIILITALFGGTLAGYSTARIFHLQEIPLLL